ncbi:MAG: sugar ABC transporter permease [Oscillospiraceae bacterium]|nr:sugar ABC transporter permease [Oscillospiraceae bacterium]
MRGFSLALLGLGAVGLVTGVLGLTGAAFVAYGGWLAAAGIVCLFAGWYFALSARILALSGGDAQSRVRLRRASRVKYDLGAWFIMAPCAVLFLFYIYDPLIESIRLSFFETKGMTTVRFVGFQNYRQMLIHPDFWPSARNSFMYTLWSLLIGFLVPIVMAVIINEMMVGKNIARTAVYLPVIVPGLATVVLWRFIFGAEASGGMNMLLAALGLPKTTYLSNPSIVIPIIVLTMTWRGAGSTALIYLAGLQGIDPQHYEAAIIDGAGVWSRVLHITIPNIYNLARTLLILQVIAVFQILYEPLVMTNGGPNNASVSMMQVVYRYAFERFDYSHATAMSVIIAAILLALTLVYNRVSRPSEAY